MGDRKWTADLDRRLFQLRAVELRAWDEIGAMLGFSPGAARSRFKRRGWRAIGDTTAARCNIRDSTKFLVACMQEAGAERVGDLRARAVASELAIPESRRPTTTQTYYADHHSTVGSCASMCVEGGD